MSSVHCVVVWEYQSGGQWVPHTPGVTRTLERAHAKKLTRVVLADADPALKGHYVNLRTLTQCTDLPDGSTSECLVRRSCHSVSSVGGRGARWEWARLSSPPLPAELHYEPMPMEVQNLVEAAWCGGAESVSWAGWSVSLASGLARRGAGARVVRRAPQPPYPLTPAVCPHSNTVTRRPRIPQQHTGSSVHSVQSTISAHSAHSAHSGRSIREREVPHPCQARGGARSASPRDRKPNLARQILHQLNIFTEFVCTGNNKQLPCQPPPPARPAPPPHVEGGADTECSSVSTRRHSVDTVSTYLSHESKDSLQHGSVGELLNCSGGSDDVFESPPEVNDSPDDDDIDLLSMDVGAYPWVRAVSCPQWGAVCPVCMGALGGGGGGAGEGAGGGAAVALAHCQHLLHLHCLRGQLRAAHTRHDSEQEGVYISCLVCGQAYRAGAPRPPAPLPPPACAPLAPQPPGSMAWRLQHAALPQCAAPQAILVTYNFQSGIQGAGHPAPGEQYYAVGFPRHSVLPDDELGRQVLALLRACWSRGRLFTVRASRTTGREHVVTWCVAPPPAAHSHYLPPARPAPALRDLCHQLHAVLDASHARSSPYRSFDCKLANYTTCCFSCKVYAILLNAK